MGKLVEEVRLWNTPIVGAYYIWRFTQGYCDAHPSGDAPIGLLHFVAMAILTNNELLKPVNNQRDNLQSYARSFEKEQEMDILLSIQQQVSEKSQYTLASIDIAITNGLVVWDLESGKLYPRKINKRAGRGKALKAAVKREGDKAEILGKWFSEHDIITIQAYLKVVF